MQKRKDEQDEPLIEDEQPEKEDSEDDAKSDITEPPKQYHGRRRRSDSNLILPSLNVKKMLTKRQLTPMPGVRRGKHVSFNDQDNHLVEYDLPSKCNSICEGQSLHDSLEQLNGPEITTSEKIERFLKSLNIHDQDSQHSDW